MREGKCPICFGTGVTSEQKLCCNCGGQYQYGKSTGIVRLNKNGDPCIHKYQYKNIGRCYHQYDCSECGDSFKIDSGD